MATKLYIGINGSGKSYEVVTVVILGALREGRRVVSNIAGLNFPSMQVLLQNEGIPADKIGSIVQVGHDDVLKTNFFRADTDAPEYETFLQPGDVLILDEIWRFWESRNSVTSRQLNFFRMHRHMVHPASGKTCEIVLITQLLTDVPTKIKGVIEKTYSMTKHTDLGTDDYYRVDVYSRAKITDRTPPLNSFQRKYNPDYFCLYKSHSVNTGEVQAKEESIDKRGNIWSKPVIKYGVPLSLLIFGFSVYFVWKFFHPSAHKPDIAKASVVAPVVPVAKVETVDHWRVMGWFYSSNAFVVALKGQGGLVRYLHNPPTYKLQGNDLSVLLPEGGFATTYSGNFETAQRGILK